MPNRENNVSRAGNIRNKLENNATKIFLNLLGNIFASMFHEVGKQGNIDRKHNVSATMFSSLPWALISSIQTADNEMG